MKQSTERWIFKNLFSCRKLTFDDLFLLLTTSHTFCCFHCYNFLLRISGKILWMLYLFDQRHDEALATVSMAGGEGAHARSTSVCVSLLGPQITSTASRALLWPLVFPPQVRMRTGGIRNIIGGPLAVASIALLAGRIFFFFASILIPNNLFPFISPTGESTASETGADVFLWSFLALILCEGISLLELQTLFFSSNL